MIILNQYIPDHNEIIYSFKSSDKFINSLIFQKSEYFICPSPICTRIIYDKKLFIFNLNQNNFPPKSSFLFKLVKSDALKFLKNNKLCSFDIFPSYCYSGNEIKSDKIGTDIDHAYWQIAKNLGIISEETFNSGLPYKSTSLAALASMGRSKTFIKYKGLEKIGYFETQINGELINSYNFVRNICFSYMNEIKEKIADNFCSWKVDEVIYSNTDYAVNSVHEILNSKNVTFKDRLILK